MRPVTVELVNVGRAEGEVDDGLMVLVGGLDVMVALVTAEGGVTGTTGTGGLMPVTMCVC